MSDDSTTFSDKEVVTEELIELVAACLASNWKKGRIKREVIYEAAGRVVNRRVVEEILTKARALICEVANVDKQEEIATQIAWLKEVVADEHEETRVKLEAQKMLQDLLGLGARWKTGGLDPTQFAAKVRAAQNRMQELADAGEVNDEETES